MYRCKFETNSKTDYLRFLNWIDKNGWHRKAFGDTWNCKFIIKKGK